MSATTAPIELAPMNLRLRLAVSALLVSWVFAALFIVLGWKVSRTEARIDASPVTQISAVASATSDVAAVPGS